MDQTMVVMVEVHHFECHICIDIEDCAEDYQFWILHQISNYDQRSHEFRKVGLKMSYLLQNAILDLRICLL